MMASSKSPVAKSPSRSATTTSWTGAIGVKSDKHQEGRRRGQERHADRDRPDQPGSDQHRYRAAGSSGAT